MNVWALGALFAAGAFLGMVLMVELGRRYRRRRATRDGSDGGGAGLGVVEGAVFALMGLLVAFTFSGAAGRLDARRQLIVKEANDIATAYLRLDLLPPAPRAALREKLREYLDTRLVAYRASGDLALAFAKLAEAQALQGPIWTGAIEGCEQRAGAPCATLLLPALNAVFDTAATRTASIRMHPPAAIFGLLGMVAMACALLAGFSMGAQTSRSWLHVVGFAAIVALTIYVTIDLEYPRLGLIRVDSFDAILADVREAMR
jgi:hypothetical protein